MLPAMLLRAAQVAPRPQPLEEPVAAPAPTPVAEAVTTTAAPPAGPPPETFVPPAYQAPPPPSPAAPAPDLGAILLQPMRLIERQAILAALERTSQDVQRAAALLEIHPATIYRRLSTWRAEGSLPEGVG
jgi:DNA-binding NtrC family response regulator